MKDQTAPGIIWHSIYCSAFLGFGIPADLLPLPINTEEQMGLRQVNSSLLMMFEIELFALFQSDKLSAAVNSQMAQMLLWASFGLSEFHYW